ncbi:MAG: chemotaxis response regulator protein-glutamate methylesterase [Treponemataceae bacterium]|nr:chemotaxis response regulator protein-glutamate methylesterase [Treponemataceae bacterium]
MINVMIVDDSALVRETLKRILENDSQIQVLATASDPIIALKKLELMKPDVIILDIEMPRMDGITFLKKLKATYDIPVVICSSMVESGSTNALSALEYGAFDIIQKPKLGTKQFIEESFILLCDTIKAAHLSKGKIQKNKFSAKETTKSEKLTSFCASVPPKLSADVMIPKTDGEIMIETTEKIVVIGASTGGTEALKVLLEQLPSDAPGIVIVQHMPEKFTKSFAERLDSLCKVHVVEAQNNDTVIRGKVLIAPGNKHTLLKRSGARYYVEVKDGPLVSRHRPSVDVLFRSTARYAGKNAVGVILTGMGDDGAHGMLEMHQAGAYTIAQDENSCVVFGMPNEAIKLKGVDIILPLSKIPAEMLSKTKLSH